MKEFRPGDEVVIHATGRIQQSANGHGTTYHVVLPQRDYEPSARHVWLDEDEIGWESRAARPRTNAWWILVRLAELMERGEATLVRESYTSKADQTADPVGYKLEIATKYKVHGEEETDGEKAELAELMSHRMFDAAIRYGLDPDRKPPPCSCKNTCPTCGATEQVWCRPVHSGERDSGGWLHPFRAEYSAEDAFYGRILDGTSDRLGPLVNADHVRSAMARFPIIKWRNEAQRLMAFANVLHAASAYQVDVAHFLPLASIREAPPEVLVGDALDYRTDLLRLQGESDDDFRVRVLEYLNEEDR